MIICRISILRNNIKMPVQTRSQSKKLSIANESRKVSKCERTIQTRSKTKAQVPGPSTEEWFRDTLKRRLNHHHFDLNDKENLMRSAYEIMYIVSEYFPDILRNDPNRWGRFAKVVYNKIYEYEYETDLTGHDKAKIYDFISFIHHLRAKLLDLFKELKISIEFDNKDLHMDTGMVNIYPPLNKNYCIKILI